MKAIFILSGHGGKDRGAVFNETNEREETIEIGKELANILSEHSKFAHYKETSTPILDENNNNNVLGRNFGYENPTKIQVVTVGVYEEMSIKEKTERILRLCEKQRWKAEDCVLIEIHINAASNRNASGAEVWYDDKKGGKGAAKKIVDALSTETGFKNRGVLSDDRNRHGRLGILSDTHPKHCFLVECGFITNDMDRRLLEHPDEDDKIAKGIYKGILNVLKFTEEALTAPAWFTDVPQGVWYEDSLKLCVQEGLVEIPTHGRFNPTPDSTRMVTMMARHLTVHHAIELRT